MVVRVCLFFSEFLVCIFKFCGSAQNGSWVGNKHLSPFSNSINFAYPLAQPWYNFICNTTFDHFLIAFKNFRLISENYCFPNFPNNLNGILYTSSIAQRMICGAIVWICCPPSLITCLILASAILSTSFDVWIINFGVVLLRFLNTWLTVSLPAYAKSYLLKNPPLCWLFVLQRLCFLYFWIFLTQYWAVFCPILYHVTIPKLSKS